MSQKLILSHPRPFLVDVLVVPSLFGFIILFDARIVKFR